MVQVNQERTAKSPRPVPRSEAEKQRIRKKILNHWNALDDAVKKDPQTTVRHMAVALDIPEPVIEQHLAEWEAGKQS